jgi:hypothetical protein
MHAVIRPVRMLCAVCRVQALGMLRKAEALLQNEQVWEEEGDQGPDADEARRRLQVRRHGHLFSSACGQRAGVRVHCVTCARACSRHGWHIVARVKNDLLLGSSHVRRPLCVRAMCVRAIHAQAVTFNNLGCLFKRSGRPEEALQYLRRCVRACGLGGMKRLCGSAVSK